MASLEKAAEAIDAGNISEAHVLLAQAITTDPNNVEAWLLLSRTAVSQEQQKTFLQRVLLIDPANAQAQMELAMLEESAKGAEEEALAGKDIDAEAPEIAPPVITGLRSSQIDPGEASTPPMVEPTNPDPKAGEEALPPLPEVEPELALQPAGEEDASSINDGASPIDDGEAPDWLQEEIQGTPALEAAPAASEGPDTVPPPDDPERPGHQLAQVVRNIRPEWNEWGAVLAFLLLFLLLVALLANNL